jgi:hypothetical protein
MGKVNNGERADGGDEETSKSNPSLEEDKERSWGSGGESKKINKWLVFLDAASYVGTNVLDLSLNPADFLAVSFYKMFGFPTGKTSLCSYFGISLSLLIKYGVPPSGKQIWVEVRKSMVHVHPWRKLCS